MNDLLKKDIAELITKYFGHSTAEAFAYLYPSHTDEEILISLEKMLNEYLGEEKTREEITKLKRSI